MSNPSTATANDHAVDESPAGTVDPAVVAVVPLGFQWPTLDPFLACVHHDDEYPRGDGSLAPVADLTGRDMGQDFSRRDGFSMYHGTRVPGFPSHPHRGFETVTFVRKGLIDHADSLGASARYGRGDVQWLTTGAGVQHSEMFPLVETERDNHLELFQIWLNLPSTDKFVDPYFTMMWDEKLPRYTLGDDGTGPSGVVTVIAGDFHGTQPLSPPPNSWAAREGADVAIWHFSLDAGAEIDIPAALSGDRANRVLYVFEGDTVTVGDTPVDNDHAVQVHADQGLHVVAGPADVEMLLLQGVPIGETVAQYGPFVMNTEEEIQETFDAYQRTAFGGWPWGPNDPDHGPDRGRFAQHIDGRTEEP